MSPFPLFSSYIERNPVRACLVQRAQDWPWSSATSCPVGFPNLRPGPVPRPADWLEHVNQAQTEAELERLRESTRRRRPYGDALWVVQAAGQLGLQASLRPRGRPRKQVAEAQTLTEPTADRG